MSIFSIVTSVNQSIVDSKHQHVIDSTLKHCKEVDFYVCNENSFLDENVNIDGAINIDLFEAIPDLKDFLEQSEFKNCHKIGKQDTKEYLNNPNEYLSTNHYWNRNSIFWFRKMCSVFIAAQKCKSDLLIWLDSDVLVQKPIDKRFTDFVSKHDVCSILRKNFSGWMFTDTGIVCYNLKTVGKHFVNAFYEIFRSGEAFKQYRWDDCYIFDLLVEMNKDKLSCCGLNTIFGAPLNYEEYFFHDKGHRSG